MAERGKIYTRTGDRGTTAALNGGRHPKSDPRFRALGALEELNASLGRAAADPSLPGPILADLYRIQRCLFTAGAAIACNDPGASSRHFPAEIAWLESRIDQTQELLPPLTHFILPGGSPAGSLLHWARTICRRAETEAVAFCRLEAEDDGTNGPAPGRQTGDAGLASAVEAEPVVCLPGRLPLLGWLNRLSDALFVMARHTNADAGATETQWDGEASHEE